MFSLTSSQRDEIRHEINLFEAMQAHANWKKRLHDYIEGKSTEDLQPHQVGMDYRCVLGKWIHGSGKARFGDTMIAPYMPDPMCISTGAVPQ